MARAYDPKDYPHQCPKCGAAAYVSPITGAIACTDIGDIACWPRPGCKHACKKLVQDMFDRMNAETRLFTGGKARLSINGQAIK